jgi:hypothetical protein
MSSFYPSSTLKIHSLLLFRRAVRLIINNSKTIFGFSIETAKPIDRFPLLGSGEATFLIRSFQLSPHRQLTYKCPILRHFLQNFHAERSRCRIEAYNSSGFFGLICKIRYARYYRSKYSVFFTFSAVNSLPFQVFE